MPRHPDAQSRVWATPRGYNWNDKVKDVFDESSDCCSFLQGIIELAANAAAALAKEFGDPTIGTFTLIDFNNRFRNTNHKFNDYVDYVCKNRKPKKCRKPRTVTRPETAIEPLPFYSGFLPGVEWDRTIDSVVIGGGIIGGTFLGGAGAYFIIVRVGGVVVFQGKAAAGAIGGILNWIRTVFGPGAGVRILPL